MHISEPARPRRQLSLTPLIDVVFLLLLFFLITSTFARFADLEVARQTTTAGEAALPPVSGPSDIKGAIVSVSAERRVRINGTETAPEDIALRLDALYDRGARTAIVAADRSATVQDLVSVLERARGSRIAIAIAR